jgi:integron integrase
MTNTTKPKLLEQLKQAIKAKYYSNRTVESYCYWVKNFIIYHNKKHPKVLQKKDIENYLNHLAIDKQVSASTQNIALAAILFLYKHVLAIDLPYLSDIKSTRVSKKIPVVLSKEEVKRLISHIDGIDKLIVQLLYGTGMRLMEGLRLRVKDVDFDNSLIVIRDGKGEKDRITMLPKILVEPLKWHIKNNKELHENLVLQGRGMVNIPYAIGEKYPTACKEWQWQYVFIDRKDSKDPQDGVFKRHHIHERQIQRAVKAAAINAEINKIVSPHTLRHSFATHLLQKNTDIRTIQKLLGHNTLQTTMIYTHILEHIEQVINSPLDD